jgi:uncharacterized repeat protein (TIGR03803 family)
MKMNLKWILFLTASALFASALRASATNFTNLYNFNGNGGSQPSAGLLLFGNTLYGTASGGGSGGGAGTIFKINTDGTGFSVLHNFTALNSNGTIYTNSDGAGPISTLVLSGARLYGTTSVGGIYGSGTVFSVDTNGNNFTNLYLFQPLIHSGSIYTNSDGAKPHSGLVLLGNTVYGTTFNGGDYGNGTIFKLNIDGTGFTNLYNFMPLIDSGIQVYGYGRIYTNSSGSGSIAGLTLSGNALYGAAEEGGSGGAGTVFKINTDGTSFTNIHSFSMISYNPYSGGLTNVDGSEPWATLALSGNTIYGTTVYGGTNGQGAVFRINTDGTAFTNLHNFVFNDGRNPFAGLILAGNTLYGTAANAGGSGGYGTVFSLNTDGTSFTNIHNFNVNDGQLPEANVVLVNHSLYGTTVYGGNSGGGTVFALTLEMIPIPLRVQAIKNAIVLGWDDTTFFLQASPTTDGVYTNVPSASSPYTNAIAGPGMFFRLKAN